MSNIEALRQLSQHCKQHKCENCELNEVSASETARFWRGSCGGSGKLKD